MKLILKTIRRWSFVTALIAALCTLAVPRAADAHGPLDFLGGPMRNFIVDLVFLGDFTDAERADVREYVQQFAGFLDGTSSTIPYGWEAAVHYYGVQGIIPGVFISDPNPVPFPMLRGGWEVPSNTEILTEVDSAANGSFGYTGDIVTGASTFSWLPLAPNHLAIVMTKGTNPVEDGSGGVPIIGSGSGPAYGFHADNGGNPYAAVMFDGGGLGFEDFMVTLSHEVVEAMTDPIRSNGWVYNAGFFSLHDEAADGCGGDPHMTWTASSGHDISGVTQLTLNGSYGGIHSNIPAASCQAFEPEEFAPMTAVLDLTRAGAVVDLFYRTPDGRIEELYWTSPTAAASGPINWGLPFPGNGAMRLPSVGAAGKPSTVHGLAVEETRLFTRGTDNAVYMLTINSGTGQGQWTPLGGILFGDPSAVLWNSNTAINVFGLGNNDLLYTYGITSTILGGWALVPNNVGRVFVSSPKAISTSASTIDVFIPGENGDIWRVPYSNASGWSGAQDIGRMGDGGPHSEASRSPVSAISMTPGQLDVLGAADQYFGWLENRGGPWGGSAPFIALGDNTGASGTPALVSWGSTRMDSFGIDRSNQLYHAYYSGVTWFGDANPIATDAVGDPVAVTRGPQQLDVFYRNTNGNVTHKRYDGTTWFTEVVAAAWVN